LKPEFAAELVEAGLPVGDVLFDCISRTYDSFAAQFFPNDEIGMIVGVHREKAHPHGHVLVFPVTRKNRRMNFSRLAPVRLGDREVRMDFQGYLQDSFARQVEQYRQMLRDKEQARFLFSEKLLMAGEVMSRVQEAAKNSEAKSVDTHVGEAISAFERDPDQAGLLIKQRSDGISRVQAEREELCYGEAFPRPQNC